MPLVFNERQSPVAGIHDLTIEEIEQYFGRFQRTDRRMTLVKKLKDYLAALRQAGIGGSLIIDGSFIMPAVDQPEDIDIILVLTEEWDMTADLRPYQYNLVSKRRVKQEYRFDMFSVQKGSPKEQEWVAFFSKVSPKWLAAFGWPDGVTKGLVRISI
jgi:hypothetical protein